MDRSFLKHAGVYGAASMLVQAGGIILVPIYLRCLGPTDYGVLEIVSRLAETVATVLLFGGFRQALMTFHQQAEEEPERRRVVMAAFTLVFATILLGGLASYFFAVPLADWLAPARDDGMRLSPGLLALAVLGILLEPLSLIPLALLQARMESGRYVLAVLAQFLFRLVLCIVLVRVLYLGVAGALAASAITAFLFGLLLTWREVRRGLAPLDLGHLWAMLRFALPMLPGAVCFFVLHHGDRFFLLEYVSAAEVGLYALAYKLAMTVSMLSLKPLYMVWSSQMYAVAKQPDAPGIFGRAFSRILAAYLFVGLGLCLFAREVIVFLGGADRGAEYAPAVVYVAPVLLGCFFQSASSLMDAGIYIRRRTSLKLVVALLSTAVMLGLYAWLIPAYGAMGAALATLGGFAFLAATTFWASQSVFPVRYEVGRLCGMFGLTALAWWLGGQVPEGLPGFALKVGLLLAVPVLAWCCGLVRVDEKAFVRDLILALRLRVLPSRRAPV